MWIELPVISTSQSPSCHFSNIESMIEVDVSLSISEEIVIQILIVELIFEEQMNRIQERNQLKPLFYSDCND
jgi:hypothetical protein